MPYDIKSITQDDILTAYSGRDGACCCGCAGKYRYNSLHVEEANKNRGYGGCEEEVNDPAIKRILNIVKKNADKIEFNEQEFIGVTIGKRLYNIYLTLEAQKRY